MYLNYVKLRDNDIKIINLRVFNEIFKQDENSIQYNDKMMKII